MADDVKVLDAGTSLMISGPAAEPVAAALSGFLRRGARLITPVGQVGRNWVAACTVPPKPSSLDATQTLHLSDLIAAGALPRPAEDIGDECRIEEFGFKRIVYGTSREMVEVRVARMIQYGAELVGEIEQADGEWVAICDTGGAQNTGFRW